MAEDRAESLRARLIRLGFADTSAAEAELQANPLSDELLSALGAAADPDQALAGLLRWQAADGRSAEFLADEIQRTRLLAVLGVSIALTDFLVRHPDELAWLDAGSTLPDAAGMRGYLAARVGLGDESVGSGTRGGTANGSSDGNGRLDSLRLGYRALLLGIAARDLAGEIQFDEVGAALADAADAVLETALLIAAAESPEDAAACRLAVIAMGKTGGSELNYISDVDVIYVAEPVDGVDEQTALAAATRLATRLQQICSAPTSEGAIWEVDAALRPEGKAGALVRTLASHGAYYERWAKTWEFQALLKARPAAGDAALGNAYCDAAAERVWTAANRDGFVADVQAMRRRVEDHIPSREAQRQLKLGRGGLRDVEFAVQLLQLVHGKSDVYVRSRTTLEALEALATWGYVAREDAAGFAASYRWLRSLEHRIQVQRLRRTHLLPTDDAALRRLARSMGLRDAEQLDAELAGHRRRVRQIHEKLFYRPLLDAVARLEPGVARLSPEAARDRLEALGYQDPQGALRHLESLTTGLSRRAQIQRTLLPVLLGWFADYPDPDAGLLGFRQVSDALGSTPWYLRMLRDAGAAERLVRVLSTSRYSTDLLLRAPDAVALLDGDAELQPREEVSLAAEMAKAAKLHDDPESAIAAIRAIRRRELFRVSVADLLRHLTAEQVGEALTDVATATIQAGLAVAVSSVEAKRGSIPTRFAVIGMGRLGGAEMSYSSDADVLFVHDPLPGADEKDATDTAHAIANELRRLLSLPSDDPPLGIDADLRPEGRQGPLVRSLASYAAYYERWSLVWESQALLRAAPIAGDDDLGERFVRLIDPIRYPEGGLDDAELREVRRIKARVETERMPRGTDPQRNLKLGPGGLADVEWTAQLMQLRYADGEPGLRTPRTRVALRAAVDAGLFTAEDADTLLEAWRFAMSVRNATTLVRGKASDTLPGPGRDLAGTALVAGYDPTNAGQLEDDYRRAARHARAVVEREFYR